MSHEGRTPPHPGKHPALTSPLLPMVGLYALLTPEQKVAALNVTEDESFGPPDWRHPGPRYLQPDTEWPERAECNFEVTR
jgi:hypothetical protein